MHSSIIIYCDFIDLTYQHYEEEEWCVMWQGGRQGYWVCVLLSLP